MTTTRSALKSLLAATTLTLMVLIAAGPAIAQQPREISHAGRWVTDERGRVVIVHGLNYMNKTAPYYPAAIGLDDDDAAFLAREGFNAVRLGVMPVGIAPELGRFSDAYLNQIVAEVRRLTGHGLLVLVDFHIDFFNERFHGQGMPDWMVQDDGLPNRGAETFNPALARAWDNFWANSPAADGVGLQDHFAEQWVRVARRLRGEPGVIGFDLINEPQAGSQDSTCLNPFGCPAFDRGSLAPFYRRIIPRIRAADPQRMLFYEPHRLTGGGAGYDLGDLGDDPNLGVSFHVYCATLALAQTDSAACPINEGLIVDNAEAQAARGGDALLLSEFGSTPDTAIIERVADLADARRVGWMEWTYNSNGVTDFAGTPSVVKDPRKPPAGDNLDDAQLTALSRPYPRAIAGTPRSWSFDRRSGEFELRYATVPAGRRALPANAITEASLPPRRYPSGYDSKVEGGCVVSLPDAPVLELVNRASAADVRLRVTPRTSEQATSPLRVNGVLRVRVSPRRVRAGHRARLRITVVREVCGVRRPAAGARLRIGGRVLRTDAQGRITATRTFPAAASIHVRAKLAGARAGSARLRVTR